MELKQLEYFCTVCEKGSFSRAAESLYTSQPNVSKVVQSLEQELGRPLFERTSQGVRITSYGRTVQEYARAVLRNASLICAATAANKSRRLSVASLPSDSVARRVVEFHQRWSGTCTLEHREGPVEAICDWVACGIADVGIVNVAEKQVRFFRHIISHKRLVFRPVCTREALLLAGPKSPLYGRESVDIAELTEQRLIRSAEDFFSPEHPLEQASFELPSAKPLRWDIQTNSSSVCFYALCHTDLACVWLGGNPPEDLPQKVHTLRITGGETAFQSGYLLPQDMALSEPMRWFLNRLWETL